MSHLTVLSLSTPLRYLTFVLTSRLRLSLFCPFPLSSQFSSPFPPPPPSICLAMSFLSHSFKSRASPEHNPVLGSCYATSASSSGVSPRRSPLFFRFSFFYYFLYPFFSSYFDLCVCLSLCEGVLAFRCVRMSSSSDSKPFV